MGTAVQKALNLACPTARDVAQWLDAPYETVRTWKAGRRTPAVSVRRKLRRVLLRHATRLAHAAERVYPESGGTP